MDGRPFGGLDPGTFLRSLPGCSTFFVGCWSSGRRMGKAPGRRWGVEWRSV